VIPSSEDVIRLAIAKMAEAYGPQGWWPVECERRAFNTPRGAREMEGYHPGQFDFPRTRPGRFEICCGAVLTQNTAWTNVQKALTGLRDAGWLSPEPILLAPDAALGQLIRPAGYFNQKSRYLKSVAEWFRDSERKLSRQPASRALLESVRPELLAVRGIGPETADSILLYAFALPTFVVDAYTRRVFGRLGLVETQWNYERLRACFEGALAQSSVGETVEQYQEAHALIVEHAKRYHGRKADPAEDFLLR
jgi:endonuclease-3 related protein